MHVIETQPISKLFKECISLFNDYSGKLNLADLNEANEAQHHILQMSENLIHEYFILKKELERNFREYERLYNLADNYLKNKDDKSWKELSKPKELRQLLDRINEYSNILKNNNYEEEEKSPVYFIKMAEWLQKRFIDAKYEDVIGLCKLAKIEDIEEQNYLMNPGRYVGVVIEEDGLTEDEFVEKIIFMKKDLLALTNKANELTKTIEKNIELFS